MTSRTLAANAADHDADAPANFPISSQVNHGDDRLDEDGTSQEQSEEADAIDSQQTVSPRSRECHVLSQPAAFASVVNQPVGSPPGQAVCGQVVPERDAVEEMSACSVETETSGRGLVTTQVLRDEELTPSADAGIDDDRACTSGCINRKGFTFRVRNLNAELATTFRCAEPEIFTVGHLVAQASRDLQMPHQRIQLYLGCNALCESTRLSSLTREASLDMIVEVQAVILSAQEPPYHDLRRPPLGRESLDEESDDRDTFSSGS